jgi:hypothetical protein
MATGDQPDFVARLSANLPRGWFGDSASTPFLQGILNGLAYCHAVVASWIAYARLQIRLKTATGEFLDILCKDFLGTRIYRRTGETDNAFRARILLEILRPRTTRASVTEIITQLTGNPPLIIEPANASDCAAYNLAISGYDQANPTNNLAGSRLTPFQCFVWVTRPAPSSPFYPVSDADIYAAIASVMPVATVAWTQILAPVDDALLDDLTFDDFILDESTMA